MLLHVLELLESVKVGRLLLLEVGHQTYVLGASSVPLDQVIELLLLPVLGEFLLSFLIHLLLEADHFLTLDVGELDVLASLQDLEKVETLLTVVHHVDLLGCGFLAVQTLQELASGMDTALLLKLLVDLVVLTVEANYFVVSLFRHYALLD